jgi:hypothetical protein
MSTPADSNFAGARRQLQFRGRQSQVSCRTHAPGFQKWSIYYTVLRKVG